MPVEDLFPIVKRAYRKRISGLKSYEPKADESLFGIYGFNHLKKRAMFKPLNDEFAASGHPLGPKLSGSETVEYDSVRGMSEHIFKSRFNSVFPCLLMFLAMGFGLLFNENALAAVKLQEINLDGNPKLVTYEERRLYFSNRTKITIGDFDLNKNGRIDPDELTKINIAIAAETRNRLKDLFPGDGDTAEPSRATIPLSNALDRLDEKLVVPPKELTQEQLEQQRVEAEKEKARDYTSNDEFFLRREGKDVTTWSGKVSPQEALLSYQRDAENGVDKGRIIGALGFLRKATFKSDRDPPNSFAYLSAYAFGGSVSINRSFDSRGADFENDSLAFRLGGDVEFTHSNGLLSDLTGWVRYETDTQFESSKLGLESVYSLFVPELSPTRKLANGLVVAGLFVPTIESDYLRVINDPSNVIGYDEYWNLGFGARLEASVRQKGQVLASFSSDYEHYWDVLGNNETSFRWVNQFNVPLGATNNTSLTLEHVLAKDGLSGKKVNEFSLGIGIKF